MKRVLLNFKDVVDVIMNHEVSIWVEKAVSGYIYCDLNSCVF